MSARGTWPLFSSRWKWENAPSQKGWSEVLSVRRKGEKASSDQRILGSSEFVEDLLSEVGEREKETLRFSVRARDLGLMAEGIRTRRGAWEGGIAIWEAAEEGIEGKAIVLSVGGGEDGISGCGGSEVSGCNDIGCNSCGLFGGTA